MCGVQAEKIIHVEGGISPTGELDSNNNQYVSNVNVCQINNLISFSSTDHVLYTCTVTMICVHLILDV